MTVQFIGKLAGVLALTVGLAGCIDATVEIEVQSETNAKATMTQVMGADIYSMVKMGAAQATEGAEATESSESSDDFCAGGDLTEGSDGSATCIMTSEGAFADLNFGEGQDNETAVFTSAGAGLVRVAFPTEDMKGELGAGDEAMDEETKAMMQSFFEGHAVTLKVLGGEIVESNMTIAGDKQSAEIVIPFLDLINGTAELPAELFAVVKVN